MRPMLIPIVASAVMVGGVVVAGIFVPTKPIETSDELRVERHDIPHPAPAAEQKSDEQRPLTREEQIAYEASFMDFRGMGTQRIADALMAQYSHDANMLAVEQISERLNHAIDLAKGAVHCGIRPEGWLGMLEQKIAVYEHSDFGLWWRIQHLSVAQYNATVAHAKYAHEHKMPGEDPQTEQQCDALRDAPYIQLYDNIVAESASPAQLLAS